MYSTCMINIVTTPAPVHIKFHENHSLSFTRQPCKTKQSDGNALLCVRQVDHLQIARIQTQ